MFGFDNTFIQQLLSWDKQCFSRFYSQTVDTFAGFVQSRYYLNEQDLQDVLSDFYVKLWRVLSRFKGKPDQFAWYVWTIFKNHLKDYFKKQREQHFTDFSSQEDSLWIEETLASDDDVQEFFAQSFDYDRIISAMKHLDETSYEIVYLKFIDSKDYATIAKDLDLTEQAVRKRLSRALYRLRKLLS